LVIKTIGPVHNIQTSGNGDLTMIEIGNKMYCLIGMLISIPVTAYSQIKNDDSVPVILLTFLGAAFLLMGLKFTKKI